ncbi:MAG: nondiscriminating glutamyl-tRNA synthetase [Patescibacteria group bacterium]|nr:nondiscriminating glutamyl-tRNA synthetase [Patescibacteria group bacterium]
MPKTAPRTRFAPSPTGYLHVGGIRTALFAWLVARQGGGQFILRLEDTDQAREVEGAGQHIVDSLKALGIDFDEGPIRQSANLAIYKKYAQKLIDSGRAYADPYTAPEVQAFREQAQKDKKPFLYRNHRPTNPPVWDGSTPLRFKADPQDRSWHDAVMGDLQAGPEAQDDFILIKSDGYPTYNFAHIVDDAEMKITHVIRGQEFLASTPNYIALYEALGLSQPILATMPHILGPDGNKKLSKRDGAKDVLDYIRDGYLPEALVSFIATLGWNDGTEQEVFTVKELIQKFDLSRVGRSGARFDEQRLLWVNGSFIRNMPLDELYQKVTAFWPAEAKDHGDNYKKAVLGLTQERLKYFAELPALTSFFFNDLPVNLELIDNNKQLKKLGRAQQIELLQKAQASLESSDFSVDDLQAKLNHLLEETGQKPGILFSLIRIATTWAPASPGLADTLHVLGKEATLARLKSSLSALL